MTGGPLPLHSQPLKLSICSLIVEEASQMLEVETLVPMFLQVKSSSRTPLMSSQNFESLDEPRLKRVVLIGDNQQVASTSSSAL
jgi:hypothetical protein